MSAEANRLRRAIFARCREEGLDDEARREVQRAATGKDSLTKMSLPEMSKVLQALGGRRPRATGRSVLPDGPHTSKLRALWISAWWLGVARGIDDRALAAWICRQTGLDSARWATPVQTAMCIEALKDWMARDGGVDWRPYAVDQGRPKDRPRARVMEALWRRLHEKGAVRIPSPDALASWVAGFRRGGGDYAMLNAGTQDQLIRELGKWLAKVSGD